MYNGQVNCKRPKDIIKELTYLLHGEESFLRS